jgi:uncharacterized membrane protein
MDVVWSREFQIALLCFLAPMAIAGVVVYCRVRKLRQGRRRPWLSGEVGLRRVLDQGEPPSQPQPKPQFRPQPEPQPKLRMAGVPHATAPPTPESLRESLQNLRRTLVEFQEAIQQSRTALGNLQECDSRFSADLHRAKEVMHHPFSE